MTRILSQLYLYALNTQLMLFPSTLCCDYTVNAIPLVRGVLDSRNILSGGWLFSFASLVRMATHSCTSGATRARLALALGVIVLPP